MKIRRSKKLRRFKIRKTPEHILDYKAAEKAIAESGNLLKWWKRPDMVIGYLKKRFPEGDPLREFLIGIARIKLELGNANSSF